MTWILVNFVVKFIQVQGVFVLNGILLDLFYFGAQWIKLLRADLFQYTLDITIWSYCGGMEGRRKKPEKSSLRRLK